MDDREVAELAQLFAAAALDAAGWMPALSALASATRSGHGELVVLGAQRSGITAQSWMSGGEAIDKAAFMAAGGYAPTANPRIAAARGAQPLQVIHEAHYDAVGPLLRDRGVCEIFHEARIEAGCQTALVQNDRLLVGLAVLRGGGDGRTTAEDRALFARVAPFARDAVHVHLTMEQQGVALLTGAFEAVSAAAFLIDAAGRVAARTPSAEALLTQGRLRIEDGRLVAPGRYAAGVLASVIAPRLSRDGLPPPPLVTVALPGRGGAPSLMADVSALPSHEWAFGVAPRVLVVVRGGGLRREAATALLRQAWDLSGAEAEVVLRLSQGESRQQIAAARGVSVETVRAQLKSVFAKLGVGREAEVAALAAALVGL